MSKTVYKRICPDCNKEFSTFNYLSIRCLPCYKKTKKMKVKVLPKIKTKVLDKEKLKEELDATQLVERKLMDDEKATIAYMLGRFNTIPEIQEYFLKKGKEVNYESVKSIRDSDKWSIVIDKERKEWLSKINEVPISNKRVRMEAYQVMLEKGFTSNKMGIVKHALQGAREEMEGTYQQIGGNNYSLTYIANMSDNELLQKRDELMSKIKRITKEIKDEPKELETITPEVVETIKE